MKKLIALFIFILAGFICKAQEKEVKKESLVWHTDVMKANEFSVAEGKPIFGFFTGSDWCIWCRKLQNDVFSKPGFIEWAQKNVVLLELDFPRGKQLSPEMQQQNYGLQQALKVQGYPTIWLFYVTKDQKTGNLGLNTLGSLGYPQGAVQGKEELKFLDDGNQVLQKQVKK